MKRLNILVPLFLFVSRLSAQQTQLVDSFLNYYCIIYKDLLEQKAGRNFVDDMIRTAHITYNPLNNDIVIKAKNFIMHEYKISDDKKAMLKLEELNTKKFFNDRLIDLTNRDVLVKYDSIYRVFNTFVCTCVQEKRKELNQSELRDKKLTMVGDCVQLINYTDVAVTVRSMQSGMSVTQRKEMSDNMALYLYTHCPDLANDMEEIQNMIADQEYSDHLRSQTNFIVDLVTRHLQKTDTVISIDRYFASPSTYESERSQLATISKKMLEKKYLRMALYKYDQKKDDELYAIFLTTTNNKDDISFMVKYTFTKGVDDKKIASVTYIPGLNVPNKKKVLADLTDDEVKPEEKGEIKIGALLEGKKDQ